MKRDLFDKAYIHAELWLVGYRARRDAKRNARSLGHNADFERAYRAAVPDYWRKYGIRPRKYWYKLFSNNRAERLDPRFIPTDMWHGRIVPHYNTLLFAQAFQDKCLHNLTFPGLKRPETVVKKIAGVFYDDQLRLLSDDEALDRCRRSGPFIVKPSVGSSQGRRIMFGQGDRLSESDVHELFAKYGRNFIIQGLVRQHPTLAAIHASSLNTIRAITLLHKGKVHVLSTVLRVGAGDSKLDNVSTGGYQCNILEGGQLDALAFTQRNGKREFVDRHAGGTVFAQVVVPSFERVLEVAVREAAKLAHFKIIGWDMAVDESGDPVFIEYNVNPTQNQSTYGPSLGSLTEEVLDEVFAGKAAQVRE